MRFHYTSKFLGIAMSFRVAFSKRSWPYFLAVLLPWLVHQGQRTVRTLRHGAGLRRHEASFYRFLSDFKVRTTVLRKVLFGLIVSTFKPTEILIAVDDTLCVKWGRKIYGTGRFFDHVARPRPGFIWGHNWVVLAVVVSLFGVWVALPFWVSIYRPKASCRREEFRTRHQLVEEALRAVRTWTSLPIRLVADGAYNNDSILSPLKELGIPLVSRLRSDAVLRKDPPPRRRRRGRPAAYGPPLPKLPKLQRSRGGWRRVEMSIYRQVATLEVKSFDAWWPKAKCKLRVVITRDPRGRRKGAILSSTDLSLTPEQIIEIFSRRWSIEQLFADTKQAIGLDSAEVRRPNSVVRHAALAFALVTLVRVWAHGNISRRRPPPTSFASQLSELREDILTATILQSQASAKGLRHNSRRLAKLVAERVPA